MAVIAEKPVEVAHFLKHCEQRRKYPVLLRVEFQVRQHCGAGCQAPTCPHLVPFLLRRVGSGFDRGAFHGTTSLDRLQ